VIRYAGSLIERYRRSTLARNSSWMFLGFGARIVVQAGYFVLIARALGPREYGKFVGITALIALASPFVSLGAGNVLIKYVARDKSAFSKSWGNALTMLAASGVVLFAAVISIVRLVLPGSISWTLILVVCISDLILVRIADIACQGFQAMNRMSYVAQLSLLPYVLRFLGAVVVFTMWHRVTALRWAWFYLGATVISSIAALVLANRILGTPKLGFSGTVRDLQEGFYFGASLSAQTVYNDIDKTMLARLSTLDATGVYAAAYRVIDVAFAPVRSVLYAAYPDFFRHGHKGIAASYAYAKRLLPKMMGYSFVIFVALFAGASILPAVLGNEYAQTAEALRWLALLPLFKSLHYFLADSLTGAGYQRSRTAAQIVVAVLNIALNFWLIPAYSWRGAAWASLASDGALVVAMYGIVMLGLAREERTSVDFRVEQVQGS